MENENLARPDIAFFLTNCSCTLIGLDSTICDQLGLNPSTYPGPLTLTLEVLLPMNRPLATPSRHGDSLLTHFPDRDPQPKTRR